LRRRCFARLRHINQVEGRGRGRVRRVRFLHRTGIALAPFGNARLLGSRDADGRWADGDWFKTQGTHRGRPTA